MQENIGKAITKDGSVTTRMQNPNEEYYLELLKKTDAEHQDITYWKYGRFETVHPLEWATIDLQKALHEIEEIRWEYGESIGFTNGRNKDCIDLKRVEEDRWRAEVPVFTEEEWAGYKYTGHADTRVVKDVTRMFFDEMEWFKMIDFKMGRHADYTKGNLI